MIGTLSALLDYYADVEGNKSSVAFFCIYETDEYIYVSYLELYWKGISTRDHFFYPAVYVKRESDYRYFDMFVFWGVTMQMFKDQKGGEALLHFVCICKTVVLVFIELNVGG